MVTGPPHYPTGAVQAGFSPWLVQRETMDGIRILRLPMVPRPNGGFLDRMVDQGSFALAALAAISTFRRSDVFVVESPPLPLAAAAPALRLVGGTPYLLHVADPWPDFPIEMGAIRNPFAIAAARAMESTAYRGAALITTVSPGLVDLLDRHPAARGKVRLLPNGVNTTRFSPISTRAEARRILGWRPDAFTVVYAGTIGLAQGLDTLLAAVGPMGPDDLEVHIVGEGADRSRLMERAAGEGWSHVRFDRPVPTTEVPVVLAAADVVVVLLRRGWLYERSLPTKFVEGLAAGRPLIVSADGDAARFVVEAGAGIAAPAEDADALAAAIREMMASSRRTEFGLSGAGGRGSFRPGRHSRAPRKRPPRDRALATDPATPRSDLMCNPACIDFGRQVLRPEMVEGKVVLEVGSYDGNGSLRGDVVALGRSAVRRRRPEAGDGRGRDLRRRETRRSLRAERLRRGDLDGDAGTCR